MKERVLLVLTEEQSFRDLLELLFEDEPDVRLHWAGDEQEAVDSASHLRPDLILLDWWSEWPVRPHPDGAKVVAQLKSDPKTKTIPVIALVFSRDTGRQAVAAGCVDWIDKAFDIDYFLGKVREHLPKQRQRARGIVGV